MTDLSQFDFSLRWPIDLFAWEARRILALRSSDSTADMVACLFAEAFEDGDIATMLERAKYASPVPGKCVATEVVDALLSNPDVMHTKRHTPYWLERQTGTESVLHQITLTAAFVELIEDFQNHGYFPKVLPKQCVDDLSYQDSRPSDSISRAIQFDVHWPLDDSLISISQDVLFSIIEYFHDQAQRPRTRWLHSYGDCGWHYGSYNLESGSAVYRWRVNDLLSRYQMGYRLGSGGPEKGRLIRHSDFDLDNLADEIMDDSDGKDDEKITSVIRMYRERTSDIHNRRAAVALLSGFLENHRNQFKAEEMTKGDESDLFHIFNKFAIRHGDAAQKDDYGEEYLQWIFWITLAAIQLLKQLQNRATKQ